MSSRFVSAGAINPSTGEVTAVVPTTVDTAPNPQPPSTTTTTTTPAPTPTTKKQAEWAAIQSQLDAARLAAATTKTAGAPEPPSLYETLQANKAAKQAAHDEATRLRNQFRALDEDEVEFLADVREAKRAEEERVRRETEEGLKAFREGRRVKGGDEEEEEGWEGGWEVGGGGKRRRGRGGQEGRKRRGVVGVVGVVGRKGSAGGGGEGKGGEGGRSGEKKEGKTVTPVVVVTESVKKPGGLVDYGSSDDDD